jgi:hypothetical protein
MSLWPKSLGFSALKPEKTEKGKFADDSSRIYRDGGSQKYKLYFA